MNNNTRVTIVGGGCIGLTTALALLEHGYTRVEIVAEAFSPDTTSDGAGAIWGPAYLSPETNVDTILRWSQKTHEWLRHLHQTYGEASGIHSIRGKEQSMKSTLERPFWAHLVDEFAFLSKDQLTHGYISGYSYRSFLAYPPMLLQLLTKLISERGGTFVRRKIDTLDEINSDIIINCAGLYGGKLAGDDDTVMPVRGQIVKVFQPKVTEFSIAMDGPLAGSYILPRPNGEVALGGTAIENDWSRSNSPKDIERIYSNCCQLNPSLREGKRAGEWVGLRPVRKAGPRVELDSKRTTSGALVFHNYGHGGSGHTLDWGCALEVVNKIIKSRL